jgi:hypothetical protein
MDVGQRDQLDERLRDRCASLGIDDEDAARAGAGEKVARQYDDDVVRIRGIDGDRRVNAPEIRRSESSNGSRQASTLEARVPGVDDRDELQTCDFDVVGVHDEPNARSRFEFTLHRGDDERLKQQDRIQRSSVFIS